MDSTDNLVRESFKDLRRHCADEQEGERERTGGPAGPDECMLTGTGSKRFVTSNQTAESRRRRRILDCPISLVVLLTAACCGAVGDTGGGLQQTFLAIVFGYCTQDSSGESANLIIVF